MWGDVTKTHFVPVATVNVGGHRVNLQMLHQPGMLGEGLEDKSTTKFIADMAEC
jgi:hypothetical protein